MNFSPLGEPKDTANISGFKDETISIILLISSLSKMRILFDLCSLEDNFSGIERYALNISKEYIQQYPQNELQNS